MGRLTSAGKERYGIGNGHNAKATKAPEDMMADVIAANGGKNGVIKSYFRHNNCAFCSVAYEMRRRGEDVRSQESLDGVNAEAYRKAVKNLDPSEVKNRCERVSTASKSIGMSQKEYDDMVNDILKDGDNSRGQIGLRWIGISESSGNMGGHALNYEVKNGTFYLVDPQVGKIYSGKDAYKYLSRANNVKTHRTDNKEFDTNITQKYFTEKNTGDIPNTAKAAARSRKTAAAFNILQVIPVVNLAVGIPVYIANHIQYNKSKKERNEQGLELEKKWQEEKRHEFYRTGKEGSKK